mgnify:CR=1 FL=1
MAQPQLTKMYEYVFIYFCPSISYNFSICRNFAIFNKVSGLVKVWVGLALNPDSNYELKDIPALFNLKDVVADVVNAAS